MSRNVCTHRRISMELSLIYFNDLMTATGTTERMKSANERGEDINIAASAWCGVDICSTSKLYSTITMPKESEINLQQYGKSSNMQETTAHCQYDAI